MLTNAPKLLVAIFVLAMASCGSADTKATGNVFDTVPVTSPSGSVESTELVERVAATTTAEDSGPDGRTPATALPLAGATFEYEDYSGGWKGQLNALVEAPLGRYNDGPGRCLFLVGVLTPTQIDQGAVSSGFSAPGVDVIANGQLIDDTIGDCDDSAVRAAGYGWILDAEVTLGTRYPFFAELFLPGDPPLVPEVIVIGSATSDNALYYDATSTTDIPAP